MNCPCCQRDNHPRRRYCGSCGCNFDPACGGCGFSNDSQDRYCGGCGAPLSAEARGAITVDSTAEFLAAAAAAPSRPTATIAPPPPMVDELAGLFTNTRMVSTELPQLPEAGIAQDDLDKLFGVVP